MLLRRLVSSLLLVLQVSGCHVWRPTPLTTVQAAQTEPRLRILLLDSSEVQIDGPWLRRDTLGGRRLVYVQPSGPRPRTEPVPLDSVIVVRRRKLSTASIVALASIPFVVAAGMLAVACSLDGPPETSCSGQRATRAAR